MTDREKVIKEFELFIKEFHPTCTSEGVDLDMLREVLALLEEQEPVKPTWSQGKAYCGKCGQRLPRKRADKKINYCGYCGQKVKWNG